MIKKILLLSVCFLGLHLTVYPQWVIIDSTATNELTSVFFPTRDTGYAVGYFQYIIKTTNGGNTWITQSNPNGTTLSSVYFTDANTGFAVGDGGLVLKTTNGGNNWDTVFYSTFNFDNFMSVFFPSKNIGYILEAGNNKNYKTVDGGNTWIAQPYTWANGGTIGSIFFTDTVTGYAAVLGGIFKTTDGGNTWAKKDSSTAGYNSI
ncbi:MAG TPA: YCF48-related protein, partial [Bacteroidia bacterium]|nr:YCF48-related protein [Bacteroidia bacterium]